ncbi:MAG: hypothetical protein IJ652_06525 [Bacteroidales bacterium]|nr:hypothetical protein [Bacteroidales bacterium]
MKKGKFISVTLLLVLIGLAAFCWVRFYYVFGDGVKAGELNQIMLKGYVFKTYEGRLIQSGFRGSQRSGNSAAIESFIFDFSVENPAVADSLMHLSGKTVELHYKEYLGALPWRGMQKTVVDRIVSVSETTE